MIGGSGEQLTLRVVAKHANTWNFGGGDIPTFNHKVDVLKQHCAEIGRDPSEIALSIQSVVNPDDLQSSVDNIQRFVDAGVTHIVLNLRPPYPDRIVTRLAEEVIPKIKG
jgi:hypothetical protein